MFTFKGRVQTEILKPFLYNCLFSILQLDEIKSKDRLLTKMEVDLSSRPLQLSSKTNTIPSTDLCEKISTKLENDLNHHHHLIPIHPQPSPQASPVPLERASSYDSIDSGKDDTISDMTDVGLSMCSDATSGIDSMVCIV